MEALAELLSASEAARLELEATEARLAQMERADPAEGARAFQQTVDQLRAQLAQAHRERCAKEIVHGLMAYHFPKTVKARALTGQKAYEAGGALAMLRQPEKE